MDKSKGGTSQILVVHPLNECDIWCECDAEVARDAVPAPAAPDERVLVRVPVICGAPDGLFDLGPHLEPAPL
jgi:hypothetical protein